MRTSSTTRLLFAVSVCALGLVIVPAFLFFGGLFDLEQVKVLMMVGTLIWFSASLLIRPARNT